LDCHLRPDLDAPIESFSPTNTAVLLWIGVVLMIIAMITYVLTLDEAEVPGPDGGEGVPVPAIAE
jgi:hypothetical protein